MTTPRTDIRRATVVSYDNAAQTAIVMPDGAYSSVIVRVPTWMAAGSLVADDEVAIIFFDYSNPDDAILLGPY